jgi:hypothetical protein
MPHITYLEAPIKSQASVHQPRERQDRPKASRIILYHCYYYVEGVCDMAKKKRVYK